MEGHLISWDLASKVITALLSFCGALAGTWLGFSKFKKEKHWQEKIAAYEKTILALESIKHWGEVTWRNGNCDYFIGDHLTDDDKDYKRHIREIMILESMGKIRFSKDFYKSLVDFIEEISIFDARHTDRMLGEEGNHNVYIEYAGDISRIASKYLMQVQDVAEKDTGQIVWWKRLIS